MWNKISLILLGGLVTAAGVMHFVATKYYMRFMPPYLPWHRELVLISGVAEILLGIGLFIPATRWWAAWGMIALFIAVFPGNVHMAVNTHEFPKIRAWMLYVRLPLQFLLIWWAYSFTRPTNEPINRS
jgi:uncharacterized membrane protein